MSVADGETGEKSVNDIPRNENGQCAVDAVAGMEIQKVAQVDDNPLCRCRGS